MRKTGADLVVPKEQEPIAPAEPIVEEVVRASETEGKSASKKGLKKSETIEE